MTNCWYPKTHVHIAPSNHDDIRTYNDSGTAKEATVSRQFGGNCESPVSAENEGFPDFMIVTTESLDGEGGLGMRS